MPTIWPKVMVFFLALYVSVTSIDQSFSIYMRRYVLHQDYVSNYVSVALRHGGVAGFDRWPEKKHDLSSLAARQQ